MKKYLLLGAPQSGKTTLLLNSGLDFYPLKSKKCPQDYACYSSKEAMVFCTDTLKPTKHRFSGIIINISLSEILLQQQTIKTVLSGLKTKTPTYLIFNKCDLIAGFMEFFADLTKEEREQIWGIMLPQKDLFEQEFDKLINNLHDRLLRCLHNETDPTKRALISYFPQQMQLCKSVIKDFIETHEGIQIRGVLFISTQQIPQEKTYFVSRLFRDVIFPDSELAKCKPYLPFNWLTALGIILAATIGLSVSYARNNDNINIIHHYLQTSSSSSLNVLKNIDDLYTHASNKWLLYFELYQPFKIHAAIEETWRCVLMEKFMPRVASHLENILIHNQNDIELLYQTFKAYLALSQTPNIDINWLKTYFKNEPSEMRNQLDKALEYPITNISLNQKIVAQTRNRLRQVSPAEFAYYEIKQEPNIYTLKGYNTIHGRRSKNIIKNIANIYEILGLDKRENMKLLIDQMTPDLWLRYNTDYINYWRNYLNNLQVAQFANIPQAIQYLDNLLSKQSILQNALYTIAENTQPLNDKMLTINQQFSPLNNIIGWPGKPNEKYKALLKNFSALRDYLITLNNAPNSAQIAWQDAIAYLQNKISTHPIVLLKKQAQQLPVPLNYWINNIANNSFGLLLQGAHQFINVAWQNNVLPSYQITIQNHFPFNSQSDIFVNLNSFGDFFGNNGVITQFTRNYLLPFIDTTHSPWRLYQVGKHTLGLSFNTIAQLEKAALIHTMYFPNGDKNPTLPFVIQPRVLDAQSSNVVVQLANQNLSYRHGPQQAFGWHWPPGDETQQASVSFTDFQGQNFSRTFIGPWAWFKLLASSEVQPTSTPGHYVWTISQDKHQASFDLWASNNMPVFNLQLLQSFTLPEEI